MEDLWRHRSYRQIQAALYAPNGPRTWEIKNWPLGSPVLVYRKDQKGKAGWKGPFTLLGVEGESCIVDQGTVAGVFRTTYVRLFRVNAPDDAPPLDEEVNDKEVPSIVEKDAPPAVEEDVPSAATPDNPPMRPRIEVRIPRRIKEELECRLIECLPPPNANTFTVSLPPMAND